MPTSDPPELLEALENIEKLNYAAALEALTLLAEAGIQKLNAIWPISITSDGAHL
jgi:hypothetical protein